MNRLSLDAVAAEASLSAGQTAQVIRILEAYLADLERGAQPNPESLLARYPEYAELLTAYLDKLDLLHQAAVVLRTPADAVPAPEPVVASLGQLGDFRLLREVGRGGMGIVYEAEQVSLARRVAVKVLPFAATLDARQRQRFKHEAQAAAQLNHPNIVPVHAEGCERGVHYFAMQFIDGQNLATLIGEQRRLTGLDDSEPGSAEPSSSESDPSTLPFPAERGSATTALNTEYSFKHPEYFRAVARLGVQAAEGLDHAHQLGVVHRDIKPANLLVDGRGQLWITDFGLARFQGKADLTRTGDLVGTLRYMSPEQALARRGYIDHRTDIYALGATLYELLTLQRVFTARDQHALLRQIATEEPPPLRRLNRLIPAELETIVLKALAKDPVERYATAQELADDLKRFLEDRPIHARRPTPWQRAVRWARQHQAWVVGAVILMALALIGLTGGMVLVARERDEAEAQWRLTLRAADEMYTQVAEHWLRYQPEMEPVQRAFLRKALAIYQQAVRKKPGDSALQAETARAYRRMGDIHHQLGEPAEADQAYRESLTLLERLAADHAAPDTYCEELALSHNNHGNLLRTLGRVEEAAATFRQARALFAQLLLNDRGRPEYRSGLAGSSNNLGLVLHALGRHDEADRAFQDALAVFAELASELADVDAFRHDLALCHNNRGQLLVDQGRLADARRENDRALALWQELLATQRHVPTYRQGLAAGWHTRGVLLATAGSLDADGAFRQALELRTELQRSFPTAPVNRQALAATLHRRGMLLAANRRYPEAETAYRDALQLLERLVAEAAHVPAYRLELASSLEALGQLLAACARTSEAEVCCRRASALREQCEK